MKNIPLQHKIQTGFGRIQGMVLAPGLYRPTTLTDDIALLAGPHTPAQKELILNILIKYFFAYLVPGSERVSVPHATASLLFSEFHSRRKGSNFLDSDPKLKETMVRHGFALCMLADLPRSAAIFDSIVTSEPGRTRDGWYTGLDIGSGSGLLMLAMWIQARRHKMPIKYIVGLERDPAVRGRASELVKALNVGDIVLADASRNASYAFLRGREISQVCNETLPSTGHRLWKEDFVRISRTLFKNLKIELEPTRFFPQGVQASSLNRRISVMLNPENRFNPDIGYPLHLMRVSGIRMGSSLCALEDVGRDFIPLINHTWQNRHARRW